MAQTRIIISGKHGSCGACHVRLRPQVVNLARRGDDLVTCDGCHRKKTAISASMNGS